MNNKILNNSTLPVPVLSPAFVTGLADGEGSFGLYLQKTSKIQTGYQVKYEFTIVLHDRDRALLENVQLFFNGIFLGLRLCRFGLFVVSLKLKLASGRLG